MSKVSVDDLAKEINKIMDDFAGATEEACESGVKTTAKDAVKKLHSAHPSGSEGQPSGKYGSWNEYNRGWTVRKEPKKRQKGILSIIHNKDHYMLTHLLEKGHAKINGGRTQSFSHIAPVAEEAEEELIKNIRKGIE